MFLHPTLDAIGYSAIENVRSAGDDVNVVVMVLFAHFKTHSFTKVRNAGPSPTLRSGRDDKGWRIEPPSGFDFWLNGDLRFYAINALCKASPHAGPANS